MFFLIFLFVIIFALLVVVFTQIKIEVQEFKVSNIDKIKLEYDYSVYIKLYAFGILKYFQAKIDKDKMKNSKMFKNLDIKKINNPFEKSKISIQNIKPKIERINLNVKVGSESVILTSVAVLLISTAVSYLLKYTVEKFDSKKQKFKIEPIYLNKNLVDLKINCIIKLKMVHIINVIYIVLKKRGELGNERTSNRRLDDDSYEQYSRYDRREHNYRGTN